MATNVDRMMATLLGDFSGKGRLMTGKQFKEYMRDLVAKNSDETGQTPADQIHDQIHEAAASIGADLNALFAETGKEFDRCPIAYALGIDKPEFKLPDFGDMAKGAGEFLTQMVRGMMVNNLLENGEEFARQNLRIVGIAKKAGWKPTVSDAKKQFEELVAFLKDRLNPPPPAATSLGEGRMKEILFHVAESLGVEINPEMPGAIIDVVRAMKKENDQFRKDKELIGSVLGEMHHAFNSQVKRLKPVGI